MADTAFLKVPWSTLGRVYEKGSKAGTSSLSIEFFETEGKIGTLKLGRSTVLWKPRNAKKSYRLSIQQMGELFEEQGYKVP
jgi:hypothetical protein